MMQLSAPAALRWAVIVPLFLAISAPSRTASAQPLQDFDLEEVAVTDGYYVNAAHQELTYLLSLNPDTLLAGFKAVSQGLDPSNAPGIQLYGGWEASWSLLRGHTMGHFLGAMAHAYRETKLTDPTTSAQIGTTIDYIIGQLQSFQASDGFLFATTVNQFNVLEGTASGSTWVPWYTMHKIIAGLVDVYELEGNKTALEIASKLGDWTYNRVSAWSPATRTMVMSNEYGGMNDCLYELYKNTKNAHHLTAAHVFDEVTLFTPISQGQDTLNGLHANTQIPKFVGALNRYQTVGASESFYLTAAEQFWSMVVNSHTYVTGGHGKQEHFDAPGQLDSNRDATNDESCNAYNMLKLARGLFMVTGDVKYADYYERTHINEVMSAINPMNGMTAYFKPMGTGYFKAFGQPTTTFWCCNGTGMENYTKLGDSVYFHDSTDLYVNYYLSSTLNWSARGLSLKQTTDLPLSNKVDFAITAAPAKPVTIRFRKPYWVDACSPVVVNVNGQCSNATEASGYFAVSRTWAVGDTVELTLPLEVRVSRLPDNPNSVAFTYGPIVLSAGLGTQNMVTAPNNATIMATIPAGVTIKDTIAINSGTTINQWLADIKSNLVQTPGQLAFTLRNTDSDSTLKFTPQYQRYADRYGIYFRLQGTAGAAIADAGACGNDAGGGVTVCSPGSSGGASGASSGMSSGASSSSGLGGTSSGGGSAGTSGGGSPPPGSGDGGSGDAASPTPSSSSCGCTVVGGKDVGGSFGIAALALVALRARRRRLSRLN